MKRLGREFERSYVINRYRQRDDRTQMRRINAWRTSIIDALNLRSQCHVIIAVNLLVANINGRRFIRRAFESAARYH